MREVDLVIKLIEDHKPEKASAYLVSLFSSRALEKIQERADEIRVDEITRRYTYRGHSPGVSPVTGIKMALPKTSSMAKKMQKVLDDETPEGRKKQKRMNNLVIGREEDDKEILLQFKTAASREKFRKLMNEEATPSRAETEKDEAEASKASAEADSEMDKIALDPEFQKEFFLSTFDYDGKVITLKKVGMGASAPVSAYVDGKRKDIFLTLKQAKRGIKKIIDIENKMASQKEAQPATVESLQSSDTDGVVLIHEDNSMSYFTFEQASQALEIHKRLNKKNQVSFEKTLNSSEKEATNMIHYFQERLKRDLV